MKESRSGESFQLNLNRRVFLTNSATVVTGAMLAPLFPIAAHASSQGLSQDPATLADLKKISDQILAWIARDEQKIVELFSKLVQCKSPSPPGDTRAAIALAKQYLDGAGLTYKEVTAEKIMPNIISSFSMTKPGRHLMFNGHVDVLPAGDEPGWTDDPWSGKVEDGKVWGRGTQDMKAGITAMLFAFSYLSELRDKLNGKISLTLVSDEETGFGRGTGFMFEQIESEMLADCVLSPEPGGTEAIVFCSKGYLQFTVRVATPGAIAGYPNESKNSILIAAQIMRDLMELQTIKVEIPSTLAKMVADPVWYKRHEELMGVGAAELISTITVDVGVIDGGESASVISPDCEFAGSIVIPVGSDPYMVFAKAAEIVARYPEASIVMESCDSPDFSDPESEMAGILQKTVVGLGWKKPEMTPATAISDSRYWRYRGTPAYWYGTDGSRCSAADEYVTIEELLHVVRANAIAAAHYLLSKRKEAPSSISTKPQMAAPVTELKSLPPVRVARATATAKSFKVADVDSVVGPLLEQLNSDLAKAGVTPSLSSYTTFEVDKSSDGRRLIVSAAYPVGPKVLSGDGFEVVDLPAFETAAVTVHRGTAASTRGGWKSLRAWAGKQGYKVKDQYREYSVIGEPNPKEIWATELHQPVSRS